MHFVYWIKEAVEPVRIRRISCSDARLAIFVHIGKVLRRRISAVPLCGCYAVSDDPFRAEREGALRGTDVGAAVGGSGAEFKTSNPNVIPLLKRQAFNSQQVREDQ